MDQFGPAEFIFMAFAGIGASLFGLSRLSGKFKMPSFNGGSNGHPSDSARMIAKLDTLIEVARHNGKISGDLLIAQRETMQEHRKTHEAVASVCNWREVDVERHTSTVKQLDRIEAGVTLIKDRE